MVGRDEEVYKRLQHIHVDSAQGFEFLPDNLVKAKPIVPILAPPFQVNKTGAAQEKNEQDTN